MSLTYEEMVEQAIKDLDGDYTSFDGDQNCEDCAGWDGESHRCECGNRRVAWEQDGDEVYARAH